MSRPKPTILLSHTDTKTMKVEQVLKAEAIYAVFYKGKPVNIRTVESVFEINPKYKKSAYGNPGHAFNLADRLNRVFKTNEFVVVAMTAGDVIQENDAPGDS